MALRGPLPGAARREPQRRSPVPRRHTRLAPQAGGGRHPIGVRADARASSPPSAPTTRSTCRDSGSPRSSPARRAPRSSASTHRNAARDSRPFCVAKGAPPPDSSRHIVDRNLALLSAVGIPVVEPAPDARYLLAAPSAEAAEFLASVRRPYALYHPGAGWPEKRWGPEKLGSGRRARSKRDAGLFPVISWGPGDEAVVAILRNRAARRPTRCRGFHPRSRARRRGRGALRREMTPDRSIWPTPSARRRSRSSARRTPPARALSWTRHSSSMTSTTVAEVAPEEPARNRRDRPRALTARRPLTRRPTPYHLPNPWSSS